MQRQDTLIQRLSRWRGKFLGMESRAPITTGTTSVSKFHTLAIYTLSSYYYYYYYYYYCYYYYFNRQVHEFALFPNTIIAL